MEQLLSAPVFALPQAAKQALLLARLNALTAHHQAHCTAYDNVLQAFGWTVRRPTTMRCLTWRPGCSN